jgi:microcystin degradation protein MlrC
LGGGSAGDSTIVLNEILRQEVPNALVVLYDPETVNRCIGAGTIAEEVILVDTPGFDHSNPAALTYHRRRHPLYPLEADAQYQR